MFEKPQTGREQTKGTILDEEEYYQNCIDYALRGGLVKEEQKETLKNDYLKPIYQKYLAVIEEVKQEMALESDTGTTLEKIIAKLNSIMESTRRIGSTDSGNIIRSIDDLYRFRCTSDSYTEYAAMALYQCISDILAR